MLHDVTTYECKPDQKDLVHESCRNHTQVTTHFSALPYGYFKQHGLFLCGKKKESGKENSETFHEL